MEMKIPAIAITAVVAIIVLAGVLMPVLNDTTATEDTYSNVAGSQGYFIALDNTTESYSLLFDGSNPGKVTVNGSDVPLFDGTILAITDSGIFRCNNSLGTRLSLISSSNTASAIESTLEIVVTNGVFTYSIGGANPVTMDISSGCFALASSGDYVMTGANQTIYVNSDTQIYGSGLTSVTGGVWNTNFQLIGSIDDGMTVTVNYPVANKPTISNESVNYAEVTGHMDLYELQNITFDATIGDDVTACSYDRIIVPAKVTAERSVHFSDNQNAIFAAIPIMVIVALLLAVVAVIFRSRQF